MDLFSVKNVKNLLESQGILPSKRLGQNFLIDKSALFEIIKASELKPADFVLEIGAGIGTLTLELAQRVKKVTAVEKDIKMVEVLKETLANQKNVEIIQQDILKSELPKSLKNYKIISNLPYYIVSPVIRKFLEAKNQPKLLVLMVQKEVAQRICSKPPDMNLLAISIQFYAKPEIVSCVPKQSFWPQPKVDGAIIKITPKKEKLKADKNLFFKIARAGFSQPRKQILNNLSKSLKIEKERVKSWLLENKISPEQRAETLTLENWTSLAKTFPC